MLRSIALVAFAAAASAQRWPTITVNSAGDIVLQALTRAASFQLTATSITTAPTSGTAAVGSGVAATTAGVSLYSVTVASGMVANAGVSLPTINQVGQTVTFIQAGTQASYNIWTQTTAHFINSDNAGNMLFVPATTRQVSCTAVTSIRWNCDSGSTSFVSVTPITTTTAAQTLTLADAQSGQTFFVTASGAANVLTVAFPTCSTSNLGNTYTITVFGAAGAVLTTTVTGTFSSFADATSVANAATAGAPTGVLSFTLVAQTITKSLTFRCVGGSAWSF
jgi:hypothetical protein